MTTNFSEIKFNPKNHSYTLFGKKLTSVTRVIKQFQEPFDREGASQRVAARQGVPVEDILAQCDAKAERSRELGKRVHQHIQDTILGKVDHSDFLLSLNKLLPEEQIFNDLWLEMRKVMIVNEEHIEKVIGDAQLEIAGTLDCLLYSQQTKLYHLFDWKTGKFDTFNQWQNLLPPFGDLDDSKLNYYSLQTSLYRLILERNTDMRLGDSYLVHLTPEGHKTHKAVDLRDRLELHLVKMPF